MVKFFKPWQLGELEERERRTLRTRLPAELDDWLRGVATARDVSRARCVIELLNAAKAMQGALQK